MSYIAPILGGIGAARSIFGGKKYKYKPQAPFQYTPDPNDPEIALRRQRISQDMGLSKARYLEELGRAGNLGSGKQFELLREGEQAGTQAFENVDESVFAQRRLEALQNWRDEEAFRRQRALGADEANYADQRTSLDALGDIGGFIGQSLYGGGDRSTQPINDSNFDPERGWLDYLPQGVTPQFEPPRRSMLREPYNRFRRSRYLGERGF